MQYEVKKIRGLNTRLSDINNNEFTAKDCNNVRLNSKGDLVKISAFSVLDTFNLGNIIDTYYIENSDELFLVQHDRFSVIRGASLTDGSSYLVDLSVFSTYGLVYSYGVKLSFVEMNKNLYIADPSGYNYVQKYDGQYITRAGVGTPFFEGIATGGTFYWMRIFFTLKDKTGLETNSDYIEVYTDSINSDVISGFISYNEAAATKDRRIKGCLLSASSATVGFPFGTTVFNFTVSVAENNLQIGDVIWGYFSSYQKSATSPPSLIQEYVEYPMVVTASSSSSVTFSIDTTNFDTVPRGATFRTSISNLRVNIAISLDKTYGYKLFTKFRFDTNYMWYKNTLTNTILIDYYLIAPGSLLFEPNRPDLESIYDTTKVKGDTPKFKYMTSFGNQIVGVQDDFRIAWSDIGIGSTCETFAPFDYEILNRSDEGVITGIFGGDSYVSIFKEFDIYHIQGVLYGKSYRIIKDTSSGVGTKSHRSIVKFNGGCLFMSDRSIYFSNGQLSKEIGDHIESIIKAIPNKQTVTTFPYYFDEKIFFITDNFALEFDYYNNEWFKQSLMSNSNLYQNKYNGSMMRLIPNLASSTLNYSNELEEKDHTSYYETAWINLGNPFVQKKFNYFNIISTYGIDFITRVISYYDWSTSFGESQDKSFSSSSFIQKFGIPNKKANVMSFRLESDASEDFKINGFLLNYEPYQEKVRA